MDKKQFLEIKDNLQEVANGERESFSFFDALYCKHEGINGGIMPELKPCPFCGGEAEIMEYSDRFQCGCKDEGCIAWVEEMPVYLTRSGAIKDWNTRAERTCDVVFRSHEVSQTQTALVKSCSGCGFEFGTEIKSTFPFEVKINSISIPNYCPNCGAKVIQDANE